MSAQWKPWVDASDVKVHCRDCTAECCKHIGIPIDEPETLEDFQRIADYLHHENVAVYSDEDGDWIVEFKTRCTQLDGNRCKAWGEHHYPKICDEYKMKDCVMNVPGPYWIVLFDTPEQVAKHAAEKGLGAVRMTPRCEGACTCIRVPVDSAETLRDFDDLWWYVAHRGVSVYEDDVGWFVQLETPQPCGTCRGPQMPAAKTMLRSWEEVLAHCRRAGLLAPDRLVLTDLHAGNASSHRPAGS